MNNNNIDSKNKISLDLENQPDSILLVQESSVKVEVLIKKMITAFSTKGFEYLVQIISQIARIPGNGGMWFNQGVTCEVLEPGKGWRKGKVKIKLQLEFYPDEPEPEIHNHDLGLDDLRQQIKDR